MSDSHLDMTWFVVFLTSHPHLFFYRAEAIKKASGVHFPEEVVVLASQLLFIDAAAL